MDGRDSATADDDANDAALRGVTTRLEAAAAEEAT